jgi:uncharacterized protein
VARRVRPVRTCVGCRARVEKGDLLRIVRSPTGTVGIDSTGSAPGRGAYVHPDPSCMESALRKGAVARALRRGLGANELGKLRNHLREHLGAT